MLFPASDRLDLPTLYEYCITRSAARVGNAKKTSWWTVGAFRDILLSFFFLWKSQVVENSTCSLLYFDFHLFFLISYAGFILCLLVFFLPSFTTVTNVNWPFYTWLNYSFLKVCCCFFFTVWCILRFLNCDDFFWSVSVIKLTSIWCCDETVTFVQLPAHIFNTKGKKAFVWSQCGPF